MDDLSTVIKKLHIHTLNDWYHVPTSYIRLAEPQLLKKYPTVEDIVKANYPEHKWSHNKFQTAVARIKYSTPQLFLERITRSLFPEYKIIRNLRADHGIVGLHGLHLEIDIYLPDLKLGFEYQDPHHFFETNNYGTRTLSEHKEQDKMKVEQAERQGITLVPVPFWWQGEADRLIVTIKSKRPELLQQIPSELYANAPLIVCEPPPHIIDKYTTSIPELGMPMLALQMPRAKDYDPVSMLIFEKYDGIRAIWQPNERQLYSRFGSIIDLPHHLLDCMPALWLDGELWFGLAHGSRIKSVHSIRAAPHSMPWSECKYMIFDTPQPSLQSKPYLERYQFLELLFQNHGDSFFELAQFSVCTSKNDVESVFFSIRAKGGEGVMLRDPQSPYVRGYSRHLYKHKGYNDAEALVLRKNDDNSFACQVDKRTLGPIDHEHNNLESYRVTMDMPVGGKSLSTTETMEDHNDSSTASDKDHTDDGVLLDGQIDDIVPGVFVSFKYSGLTPGGKPFNPQIYTIRNDITSWEQLLAGKKQLSQSPRRYEERIWKPRVGYDWNESADRKRFLNELAHDLNFDPLVPTNWYRIALKDITEKGGHGLLHKYGYSHIKAIRDCFPNINLRPEKFAHLPKHYWQSKENKRHFFEALAKHKGFDPLVASNWYPLSPTKDVHPHKGAYGVLQPYNNSLSKAIIDVFTEVSFQESLFESSKSFMKSVESRRQFFNTIAKHYDFDPLVAGHWSQLKQKQILEFKGGTRVLSLNNGSLARALTEAYPNLDLKDVKFMQ